MNIPNAKEISKIIQAKKAEIRKEKQKEQLEKIRSTIEKMKKDLVQTGATFIQYQELDPEIKTELERKGWKLDRVGNWLQISVE